MMGVKAAGGAVLENVDRALGTGLSWTISAHHRRRLHRAGWPGLLDPGDGTLGASTPPRDGNRLEVLIDGEQAFARMIEELALATNDVCLAGWFVSPEFVLRGGSEPVVLRNLLAELADRVDVRVLLWAGAPMPLFHPSRADVRQVRDTLCRGTRVRCALDRHERPLHCHHEKLLIIDGRVAFVGGIDPTVSKGDRLDSPRHLPRAAVGWHDVGACVHGPVVTDVARHFAMRWHEVTGERLPPPPALVSAGETRVQLIRTVPERIYRSQPRGEFSILAAYIRALASARRLIYLESQYLWSPEIVSLLAEKLRSADDPRFRLVIVLPAKPYGGGDDTRGALAELVEADDGRGRMLACTLYAREQSAADPIYVHAKVAIVDDRVLTLGSANLNDHSLFNDTEMNLLVEDGEIARDTRIRLWAEHLECGPDDLSGDPTEIVDRLWRPIAEEQLARREEGRPLDHRLMMLPHVSRRSARLLGPLQGLLVDG